MYPAFIVENQVKPKQVSEKFLILFKEIYERRISLKPQSKISKKIQAIVDTLKIELNGTYGKFGDPLSWLYDKQAMLSVTIGCQLSLLMLIEEYELNGISIKSANTDGLLTLYNKKLKDKKYKIAEEWTKTTKLLLEYQNYKFIYFQSVNDYIAKTINDKLKVKGDFLIDVEVHKNKSKRIIPLALNEYFAKNNHNIEDFVNNHDNLLDFCIRGNVNRNFTLEHRFKTYTQSYNKIVRYFISKNGGNLYKVKKPECTTNAAELSELNVDCQSIIVNSINSLSKEEYNQYLLNIDRNWYIDEINKIIQQITSGKKTKSKKIIKEQLSLF